MSNHSKEEEWKTVRRIQKTPHNKGSSLLSLESSASSDDTCIEDGSIHGGRSGSDVSQSGGPQTQKISPQFLQRLAGCIHVKDWKPIFRELVGPFTNNVEVLIGDIEKDNRDDCREQKYQALMKWKGIRPGDDEDQYEALKGTLQKHGCWKDIDQELESVHTGGARKKKPKQKGTGAKPKVSPKLKYEVDDQGILTIQLEGSPEPLLQVHVLEGDHRVDKVSVADALLVSIINPNSAKLKFSMELTDLTERYNGKYGKKGLSFKDIGVGRVEPFVRNKSRSLKLIHEDANHKKYIQEVEADTREVGEEVQAPLAALNPQFSESDSENELGNWDRYETASERSSNTPICQWFPAPSPRRKKNRENPRLSDIETPKVNAFNQKPDEAQLKDLIAKCEGSTIIFRTEAEYMSSEEAGSNLFTEDVVALWNTPRKGPAHIVIGVEARLSPPHKLVGLTQPSHDANYQDKFKESSFSVKPSFFYSQVESSEKVFGVISVADGGGSERECYAIDNCMTGDNWSQNDLLFRKGNTTHCATRNDQHNIYKWLFDSVGAPNCDMSERSEAFEDFMKLLDVENYERRSYCLIVSRCSDETPHLADLADFSWDQVWDFDPDSRESGLLAVCEAEDQVRLSLKTWNDPPPHAMSEACTLWLFVRGLRKREDSLVEGNARKWNTKVKKGLDGYTQLLNKGCEKKPLTVVVLWYGNKECLMHLQRTLYNIDNSDITYLICMPQYPEDKESRGLICELCNQLEIPKVIELPLDKLCCGLHEDPRYGKKQSVLSLQLPGGTQNTCIDKYKAQWLQQHLEVLNKCNDDLTITQDGIKHGESFMKGGTLSWQDKHLDTFDAKRTLSTKLTDYLTKQLTKGVSASVTIFHEPGAGGTTFSRQILWEFHTRYPCAYAFADAIDPTELCPRLEFLYESTNLPVILLVDGQESRLVKELFERSSKKINIIILSVQRYTMEIGNKTQQGEKFWLKGEVDSAEAERFQAVFSQLCSGETQSQLRRMAQEVHARNRHFVYEFGLTVYHEGYTGLRSYVAGFLELPRDGHLSNWQIAVGYLALADFYGHQKVPCQFFSDLFGKNRTDIVKADEDLTHSGKQFVIEDKQKCTWRITHYAVAQEILEQILTLGIIPGKNDKDNTSRLSSHALRNLKDFAMGFLTYASKTHLQLSIMRILQVMFIHRDYKEVGQAAHKRESLSRLLFELPSSDQLDIMEHLVKCFPTNPTFFSHLGRLHIWKQNFPDAEKHLTKAKDLRLREIKTKEERYSRNSGDKQNEGEFSQDSNLCTIFHNFGILYHEEIKQLIGGGKHGSGRQYKCNPNKEGVLQELCKKACSAVNNFTNCRQSRTKGMGISYGFLGEIKVYLHVADFIQTRFKPDGYYGFLLSPGKEENVIELLENCFSKAHGLLGEYQDLITSDPDDKPVTDDFNNCRNWFQAIFHDPDTALTYWHGNDSVDGIRSKIAVYKLKHQKDKPLARGSAEAFNNITSTEDVDSITQLYEQMFGDAYKRNIPLDISADLRDWMLAIRNIHRSTVYSLTGKVLPQVRNCCSLSDRSSPTALYYCFILNVALALFTHSQVYFTEVNSIRKKLKRVRSKLNESYRTFTWEWLGLKAEGHYVDCLVHRSSLGVWNSEKHFWQDERAHAKLQVFTGVITESTMPLAGRICITTESTEIRHSENSLSAMYVPKECGLFGKNYLNTEVEFYIGFNIEHGIQAYNVCELKKYPCLHCNAKGPVSKLNAIKKGCLKCGLPVQVHEDFERE